MSSLGVVLARGASKRLPRKNVRPLAGVPLVEWTCRAACASAIGRAVLSTEDREIAAIGRAAGIDVPFVRPGELAEDFARDVDILMHAVEAAQAHYGERYESVVLIQATTPFVRPEHFDACLERLAVDALACVFAARKAEDHPRWTWKIDADGHAHPYIGEALAADEQHGQKLPPAFYPSGAAWAVRIAELRRQDTVYCEPIGIVEMPWEYAVDIDDERDWAIAEAVARQFDIRPIEPAGAIA